MKYDTDSMRSKSWINHVQYFIKEPDLEALAKQAEERKQRAEKRHRKALREQKFQKEKLLHEQIRYAVDIGFH